MAIAVACECGRRFEAFDSDAGAIVECPACGRSLAVPKGEAGSEVLFVGDEAPETRKRRPIWIVLGVVGCLFLAALTMPAIRSARGAARRAQCVHNLKQIGLALHNYHDVYGCLPPAALCDKEGRPLLSWRVAILPFLEQNPVAAKIRLDEAWDSPHNRALVDQMPGLYRCPSDATLGPGMTDYQVVVGPGTAFRPDFGPVRLEEFADGTASTLLVGESRHPAPWTKPENLAFEMDPPFAGLGGHHGYHVNGFNALFGDGSVRFLYGRISARVLGALLTRSGHEATTAEEN